MNIDLRAVLPISQSKMDSQSRQQRAPIVLIRTTIAGSIKANTRAITFLALGREVLDITKVCMIRSLDMLGSQMVRLLFHSFAKLLICATGFPPPHIGSSEMLGFDTKMCFDRYGRFGAYGLQSKDKPSRFASKPLHPINWEDVDWGSLQRQCISENENRFNMDPRPMPNDDDYEKLPPESHRYGPLRKQRTAILFRSYDGFKYTTDSIRTMRSVITELALQSGGEYEAFLLVQVKDTKKPIFDDPKEYENVVHDSVPKEFRNITVLWHEGLWGSLYPKIPSNARK